MKFLITGATSGLGRNAVEWLLQKGHEVHATGRNELVGKQLSNLGARFTALDLVYASEQDYRELLQDSDIVWHCAALSSPWGKYEWFYQTNVVVTSRLAYWAGKVGVKRFVHVSSPSIYFDFKSHTDITESYLPLSFANHYAASKFAAEQAIQQQVITYPSTIYIILRPRGLFGPHDSVIFPRLLAQMKRTRGNLPLPNKGLARVDLTFVLNVVYALFLASTNATLTSGEVFNITNQQPCQLSQLIEQLLKDRLQMTYQIRSVPYHLLYGMAAVLELCAVISQKEPALTRYSVGTLFFDMTLSQQRAIDRLGYKPFYTMDQAIGMTADWLLHKGSSANG